MSALGWGRGDALEGTELGHVQDGLLALGAHRRCWPCGSAGREWCPPVWGPAPGQAGASLAPGPPSAAQAQGHLTSGLASAAAPAVRSTSEQPRLDTARPLVPPMPSCPGAQRPGAWGRRGQGRQQAGVPQGTGGGPSKCRLLPWHWAPHAAQATPGT